MPNENELEQLCVVMVATRNPLNLGAAARAMSNFGCFQLRVVQPYEVAFREARSAVGAEALLQQAEEYASVAEAVADCSLVVGTTAGRSRELQHSLWQLPQGARTIQRRLAGGKVALLFGSEKRGLSNEDLSHCHWLLRIPTREGHPSMNLGQAVAVCLYELARPARIPASANKKSTPSADLERITQLVLEALRSSGYLDAKAAPAGEEKLRRLVRRLDLPNEDAALWLGMWRQIVWKLRQHD